MILKVQHTVIRIKLSNKKYVHPADLEDRVLFYIKNSIYIESDSLVVKTMAVECTIIRNFNINLSTAGYIILYNNNICILGSNPQILLRTLALVAATVVRKNDCYHRVGRLYK